MKRIKIETDLENLCSVVMEEAKDYDYEEERPSLGGSRRRRAATLRDIERHTCSRCSKSYIHAWHLKRHTKFECGQEPRVQCPYCAARMKQRGHVYRHIRQCHRGQNVYVIDLNWGQNDRVTKTWKRVGYKFLFSCYPWQRVLVDMINKLWTSQEIKNVKEQLRNNSLCYCSVLLTRILFEWRNIGSWNVPYSTTKLCFFFGDHFL